MVALSMRLRLSPQARDKHQPSREQKKLSYYDRAALARHADASTGETCDEGGDGSDEAS
jgi:hypothetical protein